MATYVQDGEAIDYTPTSAAAAGDVIVQGGHRSFPLDRSKLGVIIVVRSWLPLSGRGGDGQPEVVWRISLNRTPPALTGQAP
jgi:hypothetical protein